MSYMTLLHQLSVEFMTDLTFDKAQAKEDLSEIWKEWRSTHGRHLPIEQMSEQFGRWWQTHYDSCLKNDGLGRNYRGFIRALANKLVLSPGQA